MKTLVIGYGNTLRRDDGVGYQVAATVASWDLPDVLAWPEHQLLPEMAATLAVVEQAIFVDAQADQTVTCLELHRLQPQAPSRGWHHLDPTALLALSQQLYGRCPPAYGLWLPVTSFEFGEQLSLRGQASVEQALVKIQELFGQVQENSYA